MTGESHELLQIDQAATRRSANAAGHEHRIRRIAARAAAIFGGADRTNGRRGRIQRRGPTVER